MRSERRNISVTNEIVSNALDSSDNVSKYIERAILYYIENTNEEYATKQDFEILNQNYLEMRDILKEIIEDFLPKGGKL